MGVSVQQANHRLMSDAVRNALLSWSLITSAAGPGSVLIAPGLAVHHVATTCCRARQVLAADRCSDVAERFRRGGGWGLTARTC